MEVLRCSFCHKTQNAVERFIESSDAIRELRTYICNECVAVCNELLGPPQESKPEPLPIERCNIPGPHAMKAFFDDYVIGQDSVKKRLAVAVYNHFRRIFLNATRTPDDPVIEKSNILLVGPTGTGKTLFARTIAKKLDVPFVIADATTLTQAGYVGEDVESIILKLLQAADGDVNRTRIGIVYIDEIDKIARKEEDTDRDVSGEGVQQGLLKILEGTVANVWPQGYQKDCVAPTLVDTTNILFICGGAFVGLEKIVGRRIGKKAIGFTQDDRQQTLDLLQDVQPEDLIAFGLIPEFVGRLPVVVFLEDLDEAALVQVLTHPKDAIVAQYCTLLNLDNVRLEFAEDALQAIAHQAVACKSGARGLRMIMEEIMLDLMYLLPGLSGKKIKNVCVTKELVDMPPEARRYRIKAMMSGRIAA